MSRSYLLTAGLLLLSMMSFAANEDYFNYASGAGVKINAVVDVKDGKFQTSYWDSIEKNLVVTDLVIFEIDDNATTPLTQVFTCRIDLQIVSYNSANVPTTMLKSLNVAFDPANGKTYRSKQAFKFIKGHHIVITVQSITYKVNNIIQNAPPLFKLTGEIQISRIYKCHCNFVINPNHSDTTNGFLEISWLKQNGAEEYDLEWTFLDDSSQLVLSNIPVPFSDLFKNNATRITTQALSYRIHRAYSKGYIFYRIRGIHYDKNHHRQNGSWSGSADYGVVTSFQDKFHNPAWSESLNWEYNISFAEDGKKTEAISYYDGTLRSREALGYNNSTQQVMVGETFYDHVGRAAVQALPVPVNDSLLSLHYPFNTSLGQPYDFLKWETGGCNSFPLSMDSSSGASYYYSSKNTDTLDFQKYLPKAFGFPFSVTEFTPDNTGRIHRQSGVGKDHQLGLHDTKYFYGKPEQEDLDRLFGNEAGFSAHYLKNLVVDPNGQMSVTYQDSHGRTIATALAGEAPSNLAALASNSGPLTGSYNLLDNNLTFNYGKINNHKILGTSSGMYSFSYNVIPTVFKLGCDADSFCYDGYYDLKITITDDCMNAGLPGGTAYIKTAGNYVNNNVFVFDTLCNSTAPSLSENFSIPDLPPGGYNISKTLTVSDAAVQFYTDHYLRNNNCLVDSETFIQQAIAAIDFSGCDINCAECNAAIGTKDTFIMNYLALISISDTLIDAVDTAKAEAAYDAAVKACDEACNGHGTCEALYGVMLSDVMPGHQWAQYFIDAAGSYHPKDQLSALYYYSDQVYTDENGKPDSIYYNYHLTAANELPLKEFVLNFRPWWANPLVIYHPEYCYYKFCNDNAASNAYDEQMMRISSYSQALSEGYLNPAPGFDYPGFPGNNKDPFLTSGFGFDNGFTDDVRGELTHYISFGLTKLSAWAFAVASVNSIDNPGNFSISQSDTTFNFTACSGELDAAWSIFRSIYQTIKFKYIDFARETYVSDPNNIGIAGLSCHSNLCMTLQNNPGYIGSLYDYVDNNYCSGQGDPYNVQGYIPRVIHYEAGLPFDSQTNPDSILYYAQQSVYTGMDSVCKQSCNSQADFWMQDLDACDMSVADSILVREGFIEVCMAGCDLSHPYGASTTPSGTVTSPHGYTSFEDVLQKVLNVSQADTGSCNALMITSPGPYTASQQNNSFMLYTKDECVCNNFNALQDSFSVYGGYVNLAGFINAHYNSNMTQDQVEDILAMCNDAGCNFLSQPVSISMALSCDTDGCKSCHDYQVAKFMFSTQYPYPDFSNYETFFTAYMNQLFGFNLTYPDYHTFELDCNNTPAMSATVVNDTADDVIISTVTMLGSASCGISVCYIDSSEMKMFMNTITSVSATGELVKLDTTFLMYGVNYHILDSILIDSTDSMVSIIIRNQVYENNQISASTNTQELVSCNCNANGTSGSLLPVFGPKLCGDQFLSVEFDTTSCHDQLINMAITNGIQSYHDYIDSVSQAFGKLYREKAMEAAEVFTVTKPFDEYHYTLYYFDQAGNLVKTVPPAGVALLKDSQIDSVENHRMDPDNPLLPAVFPKHSLFSRYWFNTLNATVKQFTPDADSSHFWYDRLGRLVVSQSARQRSLNQYSYTLYDGLGRIIEVGQLTQTTAITNEIAKNSVSLSSWIVAATHMQITHTYYDATPVNPASFVQTNLRNRVAGIQYEEKDDGNVSKYQSAIYYSYDVSGNVQSMLYDIQELAGLKEQYKRIDYDYDLVSGKVNKVYYQKDSADQFVYKYLYDAMNRVIGTETSKDGYLWERDASYQYYDHGPLARTEIGDRQVQGMDYAYTIDGWMKGINGLDLNTNKDMGNDGVTGGANNHVARDAFGMVIGYFDGDYSPVGKRNFEAGYASTSFNTGSPSLYNGNIRNIGLSVSNLTPQTIGYTYKYDQLNRLISMDAFKSFNASTYKWKNNIAATGEWKEKASYDANGNILSYLRHGNGAVLPMDSFTYSYNGNKNQLNHVDDGVAASNYTADIDDQNADNYLYDASGNLIKDVQENLTISWNAYGKVSQVYDGDNQQTITFRYDPTGNRLVKQVQPIKQPAINTYYIRDAQGNILATYRLKHPVSYVGLPKDSLWWDEQDLYGSNRVGIAHPAKLTWPQPTLMGDTGTLSYFTGWKNYELTNHLGNVLSVISDKKIGVGSPTITSYKAEVLSATDYYPFGMVESGREFNQENYRFGFGGQEKLDEISGNNNHNTALFWEYNIRLGRRWNLDPKPNPCISSYAAFKTNPIFYSDILGDTSEYYDIANGNLLGTINDGGTFARIKIEKGLYDSQISHYNHFNMDLSDPNNANNFVESLDLIGILTEQVYQNRNSIAFETGIEMEFTGGVELSSNLQGLTNTNITEYYAIGNLTTYSNFDDNSRLQISSVPAISGPHNNGPIPNGIYEASDIVNTTQSGMVRDGIGFKIYLSNNTVLNRTALRIHPDQDPQPGTSGCIGLQCDASHLNNFRRIVRRYFANDTYPPTYNVNVNIINNPNYNGNNSSTPGE